MRRERHAFEDADLVFSATLRPPFGVLIDRVLSAVLLLGLAVGLVYLPIRFGQCYDATVGITAMLVLLAALCLTGAVLLAAPLRPLRVGLTRSAVCFSGLAGPVPCQIALTDIVSCQCDPAFRLNHLSVAHDKARYVPWGGTWVYSAGVSTYLRDYLRTFSGLRIDLREGKMVFIEMPHPEELAAALGTLGVQRVR